MQPAARTGDAICHGGAIASGSPNVLINGIPAAVLAVSAAPCALHGGSAVSTGSATVMINNLPAARMGDVTCCGASIVCGSPDVMMG